MEATTTVSRQPGGVQAEFKQDVSGNLIIGNHNVQINAQHGSIVNLIQKEERPRRIARETPVRILPRRFDDLLDRRAEVELAVKSLSNQRPLDIYAQSGMGKTSLLRFLSRHSLISAFPDGVIYLRAAAQPVEDLLQSIYDAFYEYTAPYKPSQGEIRQGLQDKQALIVLDDVALEREEVEALMDAAPESNFLLASTDRRLWGQGDLIALPGLPEAEGTALFAKEVGRPLERDEEEQVRTLCLRLRGHPLRILQAASLAREGRIPIEQIAAGDPSAPAEQLLSAQVLGTLDEAEKKVTAAVGALRGAPLHRRHLRAMTGLENTDGVVERLLQRGVVQAHSPKYTLTGDLGSAVEQAWDLKAWRRGALDHLSQWGESQRASPHLLAEENEAVQSLLEWAAGRGLWRGVLRLVYLFEGSLMLAGRWGAWAWVLQRGMEAAQALGNQPARAWVLHQLGTRALCLDQTNLARDYLIQALRLREALGDWDGAAITRHNLNLILGGPPSSSNGGSDGPSDPPPAPSTGGLGPVMAKVALIAMAVIAGALALAALVAPSPPAAPELMPTTVAMVTLLDTPRPTETFTLTPSPSASATDQAPADTPTPTETTMPPTQTPTERPATVTPSITPCRPVADWPVYQVQDGDTLSSLARETNMSVTQLMLANCLTETLIFVGQTLSVPQLPVARDIAAATTVAPTLTESPVPTTALPTTAVPTTAIPTTIVPTTALPTTAVATTAVPTTSVPTTAVPTTAFPTTPVPTELPDIVAELDLGQVTFTDAGIEVPFYVVVSNQGGSAAGPFSTGVFFRLVGSNAPAEGSRIFDSKAPLAPGDDLFYEGVYEIGPEGKGYILEAEAMADYCSIRLALTACQVLESDESNNQAGPLRLPLN